MAERYENAFQELSAQILIYSPKAARILEFIREESGTQAAYYAAFVLVCMHARKDPLTLRINRDLTLEEVRNFTFFEYVNGDEKALRLFCEMLNGYNEERQLPAGV